jgi:hypothetical protein
MKLLYIFASVIAIGVHTIMIHAAAQGNVTTVTKVYSCNCTGCTCNFYVNAVGDLKDIQVTAVEQKLSPLTRAGIDVVLKIPRVGEQSLYSLVITTAYSKSELDKSLVNKPMLLLFVSEKPDSELLKSDPTSVAMTKVYRRLFDETLWTEVATLPHDHMISELFTLSVHISPNGNVSWTEGTEKRVLPLGKAILG